MVALNKFLLTSVAVLAASMVGTSAFTTPFGITQNNRLSSPLFAEGGASLAKPAVEIGQKTATGTKVGQKSKTVSKKRVVTDEPVKRREPNIEDAPMYKVMLIGDEEYDQAHCISRITEVMEDIDENRASVIFQQAQSSGKSMCGKYPMEHAELYVEQLLRSDPMIYSELLEENETK